MGSKLCVFEKIPLFLHAYSDVRKKRVEIVSAERQQQQVQQGDRRADQPAPTATHYLAIYSPMVESALSDYESYREHYLSRRKNIFFLMCAGRVKLPRVGSFSKMMGRIDAQINEYEAQLAMLTLQYGERIAELNRSCESHEQRKESHMVQLCKNQVREVRAEYYKKSVKFYVSLVQLFTQKLNKLKSADEMLSNMRMRAFRRIRYYHEKVCILSPYSAVEVRPFYLTNEALSQFGNCETTERYKEVFDQTEADLHRYKEDLDRLMP
mgnify:CR=1 FL=1